MRDATKDSYYTVASGAAASDAYFCSDTGRLALMAHTYTSLSVLFANIVSARTLLTTYICNYEELPCHIRASGHTSEFEAEVSAILVERHADVFLI